MNKSLKLQLDILRPLIHVVTEEEDRLVDQIYELTKNDSELFIYKTTTGILSYKTWKEEPEKKEKVIDTKSMPIHTALTNIQSEQSSEKRLIYILLDTDHHFSESQSSNFQNIRKLKDIVLNIYKDYSNLKTIILVSSSLCIPSKLIRYSEVIYYDLPDEEEIENKVENLLNEFNSVLSKEQQIPSKIDKSLKLAFKGLTLFEIEQIVLASLKNKKVLSKDYINAYKKSILRKTDLLDILETDVDFDQIGGLSKLKLWLEKRKDTWSEEAIKYNIPTVKGVMAIGITGCGKSVLAKAVGNHWGLPLISFSPSKIFSSRVGESEARLMKALKILESVAPCAVLIDEIEKQFAGSQSSTFSDAGTTARFIGTFLTWYEDCTAPIFIFATCNDIRFLPPELISRFDDKFFVPLPSTTDRVSIYDIHIKKTGRDAKQLGLDLYQLAVKSTFFTGREIMQVVKSALVEMWYEAKNANIEPVLTQEHFLKVLDTKVPMQKTMQEELDYLVQWVGWDPDKKDGIRANYASEKEDDIDQLFTEILSKPSIVDKKNRGKNE